VQKGWCKFHPVLVRSAHTGSALPRKKTPCHQRQGASGGIMLRGSSTNQETAMNMILKSALMAATIAGATAFVPTLANAQVGISVGIGVPLIAPVYAPCGPGYGPCPEGYNPYEGSYYYDPIFFGGSWYHGPYRWQMVGGEREFWVNGGWHRNEWAGGAYPSQIAFRNGGYYRGGHYDGFNNADRINARFHTNNVPMSNARPEAAPDRGRMNQDRPQADGPRN
jgi:hypothetical protein